MSPANCTMRMLASVRAASVEFGWMQPNAGPMCRAGMLPLARELLGRGTQVVLAANSRASINDITAPELAAVAAAAGRADAALGRSLAEGALRVVPSGSDLPVIDLRQVWLLAQIPCRPSKGGTNRPDHAVPVKRSECTLKHVNVARYCS